APELRQPLRAAAVPLVEFVEQRVLLVIVLVVVLGRIERARRQDFGGDGSPEAVGDRLFGLLGKPLLRLRLDEDRAAVGVAAVAELAARIERVDIAPEGVEQRVIADRGRVVAHPHRLEMPRAAGRDLLVTGIGDRAARVAGDSLDDALDLVERFLHAPEAAAGEHGRLEVLGAGWRFRRLREGRPAAERGGKGQRRNPSSLHANPPVFYAVHRSAPSRGSLGGGGAPATRARETV